MPWYFKGRETAYIALLFVLTLTSFIYGHDWGPGESRSFHLVLLALAAVKVRVIIFRFQHVAEAPRVLRLICDAWLAMVVASLALFSMAV